VRPRRVSWRVSPLSDETVTREEFSPEDAAVIRCANKYIDSYSLSPQEAFDRAYAEMAAGSLGFWDAATPARHPQWAGSG